MVDSALVPVILNAGAVTSGIDIDLSTRSGTIAGIAAKDDYAAYGASKAAISGLTRAVAAHCRRAKYRIRCNSIHPDGVMTPMTAGSYPKGLDPARITIDGDPMNRACLPTDVAAAILFLADDASRAVNGIELRVDSGQFVMSI